MANAAAFNIDLWTECTSEVTGKVIDKHHRMLKTHPLYPKVLELYRKKVEETSTFRKDLWNQAIASTLYNFEGEVRKDNPHYKEILTKYQELVRLENHFGVDPGPFDEKTWKEAVFAVVGSDVKVGKDHPQHAQVLEKFRELKTPK